MAKYPSIKATLSIIRAMGLCAYYSPDTQEFRITIPNVPASAYFTNSRHDAIFTARFMSRLLQPIVYVNPTHVCARCGSDKPVGQSCGCFDNGSQ